MAAIAATGAGLHALPAAADATSSPEVTLQVVGSSTSPQLLRGLTLSQFAALVRLTPEQLVATLTPSLMPGSATVELNALLADPAATVGDLIGLLAAAGVPETTIAESFDRSLAAVTGSAEQLAKTLNALLADLAGDGRLSTLAGEVKLPAGVVEALSLVPTSTEEVSESLSTTTDHLGALLGAAGASAPGSERSLATTPLRGVLPGSSTLLGVPGGSGGVTLVTVSSTTSPTSTSAGSAPTVSSAFSVVSVKVTRSGRIVETVRLSGPGRLAISASAARTVRVRPRHGHSRLRTRSAKVASAAGQQTAGTHTITLRPRGRITKARRYRLTLITTFTPTGGMAASVRRSLVVKHTAKKSRARKR